MIAFGQVTAECLLQSHSNPESKRPCNLETLVLPLVTSVAGIIRRVMFIMTILSTVVAVNY